MARVHTTHGRYKTREYGAWAQMVYRCTNAHARNARHYIGRGITVCDRWRESFENFFADMGGCPPQYSLERLDNEQGYSPANCCWADIFQQNRNRRCSHFIEWNGQRLTVTEWAHQLGAARNTVKIRWTKHHSLAPRIRRYRSAYPPTRQPSS